ncbi:GL21458 [Drosophila persimilis]|uniref:GL21458 n=1 Tax=Drosophila persimilis TaxID=7234 RepID=B4IRX4_DROPE|nr:GL21458 [Drosophila persimilis]
MVMMMLHKAECGWGQAARVGFQLWTGNKLNCKSCRLTLKLTHFPKGVNRASPKVAANVEA